MPNCLIVDDSKVIRKVARHILESLDLDVHEAQDGREALDMCEGQVPDVVLLDWNMPVMSGLEFLKELSRRNFAQPPKVIFCTTENGVDHIRAAVDAGADEYVMKPFDRDTLESKLQIVGIL
ncbi:response regulator [Sphingobium sp. B12D2B]|uniref:response regulator n=1 Tax=Sphingobium sp. B12D2B TaxID=2940577 RepID=UPI002224A5F1|nr:response regulator [Sphingobium sp. B12D2B]MCW2348946.1 two-component system chemotaxis response regulator CheY [Sphingobium sp. B12D2B]